MDEPSANRRHDGYRVLAPALLGLAFFLAWQAVSLRSYLRTETRPPAWDQAIHLEIAYDYRAAIEAHRWSDLWRLRPKPGMPPFPPLYHLGIVAAQHILHAGNDPKAAAGAALWLNWAYLVLLCVCIFGLAYDFGASALAAAVAFACAPAVQSLLHTQLIDLALTAWAAAAYWALVRSEGFRRWPGALAFGLACAAGFLHKWSFFSYLLPPAVAAISAWREPKRRPKVLSAAAITGVLAGPWYLANLPPLFPRLFQATSDFAVPFWKNGAFFVYFSQSMEALGPALFLFGWIAAVTARMRRRAEWSWLLPEWIVTSYIFWAIVPNRQFRFLLPGLPALAVLACGTWPRVLIWLMAVAQLAGGANFTTGRMHPIVIPSPIGEVRYLVSEPPAAQDWRIADILREAANRRAAELPFANLTLVANDVRFNGPNFNWMVKMLGVPVKIRGVNKRLCEFSQFVVLKRGALGPPGVIGGLPEAAALIQTKGGWFQRAYEEAGRWPLPDGSEAVLYAQKALAAPPLLSGRHRYAHFESGEFSADGLTVEPGPWDPASSSYAWVRIAADAIRIRGLEIDSVKASLERVRLVSVEPQRADAFQDVRLLSLGRLKLDGAVITAANAAAFAQNRMKGLHVDAVDLDGNMVLRASLKGVPLAAGVSAGLTKNPPALYVGISRARVGPVSAPPSLLARLPPYLLSLEPTSEMPFRIDVAGLTLKNGRLTIP